MGKILSTILLVCGACCGADDHAPRILCYGDSITRGTYVEGKYVKHVNWVEMIQRLSGDDMEFINAGRSGRRTGDFKGLEASMKTHHSIDRLILFLGVNDLNHPTQKKYDACVANIEKLIQAARRGYGVDVKIYVVSSPGLDIGNISERFHSKGYNAEEHAMLEKLRRDYRKVAAKHKVQFIDLWGSVSAGNFSDGLHLDQNGQLQIAKKIHSALTAE
jgi:acyl-CoA thioesterase I